MSLYKLPKDNTGFLKKNLWWIAPLIVFDTVFLIWWFNRSAETVTDCVVSPVEEITPPPEPQGLILSFPTPRENPLKTDPAVLFMPTESGRTESAHYGSVRTVKSGKSFLPSFHEGIDIAPVERDRSSKPIDQISAAADGHVLYVNSIAGNSNYGKYIVLGHDDPLGEIYTLYAHLAEIEPGIAAGKPVSRGDVIGKMGNTASTGLPLVRAHLHFEIGVINNGKFYGWFKKKKTKPDHGTFHGYNLAGVNPVDAISSQDKNGRFNMKEYLAQLEPAFTIAIKGKKIPDYFSRYPSLWEGPVESSGVIVLSVSEGGVILSGRSATREEIASLGKGAHRVLSTNGEVLGRNGLRLIVKSKGQWELGKNGTRWLEILAYH